MKKKAASIMYYIAVAAFCGALIWSWAAEESSKTDKFTYVINEKRETTVIHTSPSSTAAETVTTSKEVSPVSTTDEKTDEPLYIDINTADAETLTLLKGIGDKLAAEIISYRELHGGFNNIEEIMNVKGIGEGIFGDIRDLIYVKDPVYPEDEEKSEDLPDDGEYPEDDEASDDEPEIPAEDATDSPTEPETSLRLEDVAPIELNEADEELLMLLPYVDEERAAEIISLRESIHGFQHPYELLYVESLTQEQVAEIINYVYVDTPAE